MINPSPSSLLWWCSAGQSAVFTPQWNEIISAGWASDWERREIIREWWVFWGRADLNTRGFRFVLCRFQAFVPTETHSSFITRVSIIIVFIKRLVKRRKTLWFCGGISRKRAAGWLRRSSAPRRPLVGWMPVIICLIWYEEEWSEPSWLMLIWTDGWKEGWMDGWTPSSPPPSAPVSPAPTPPRRWRPAGILLHIHGVQSDNGCLSDRKLQDWHGSDLRTEPEHSPVFGSKQEGNTALTLKVQPVDL